MLINEIAGKVAKIKNEGVYEKVRIALYDGRFVTGVFELMAADALLKSGKFFAAVRHVINNTRYTSYTVDGVEMYDGIGG